MKSALLLPLALTLPTLAAPELWYDKPAAKWTEALPVGNGRIGAMVFGSPDQERLQFNEDTIWTGKPHNYANDGAVDHLPEIRRLLFAGKQKEAEKLAMDEFMSVPLRQMAYQPCADLMIDFDAEGELTGYRRSLDLDAAVVRSEWTRDGTKFIAECISSHPDQVIAWHISSDPPGRVTFGAGYESEHKETTITAEGERTIVITGGVSGGASKFQARTEARVDGGKVAVKDGRIEIENADSTTLLIVARSNHKKYNDLSADPAALCAADLKKLAGKSWKQLLDAHQADHRALFRRVTLDLGGEEKNKLPTDQRLKPAKTEPDPALDAMFFQYGRYLLIASSRPGSQPANLQGIWNDKLKPPWDSSTRSTSTPR
jgi:alpha-L-fucosidase 2